MELKELLYKGLGTLSKWSVSVVIWTVQSHQILGGGGREQRNRDMGTALPELTAIQRQRGTSTLAGERL